MLSKIVLITGGSRGLGKAMALACAGKGLDVIITYQTRKEDAEQVVESIEAMGRKARALPFDLSNISAIESFIPLLNETLKTHFQSEKIDYLVNNAGMGASVPIASVTETFFDQYLNVHFKGVYFLTQQLLLQMNDGGGVVLISSGSTRFGVAGYSVYASMKGAIEVFCRYLAKEYGGRKIRANVVAPGPIETDFNNAMIRNNPQVKANLSNLTALGRVGASEDVGGVVAFLCTEEAYWVNGQRIEVSGGVNL